MHVNNLVENWGGSYHFCAGEKGRGGVEGLPYIAEGDACRNFQKQPLKVTILGVAPANFIP